MSTLENTVSMMKALPETDLIKIQDFTKKLFQRREFEAADEAVGKFLKPMSREDLMRDIETGSIKVRLQKPRPKLTVLS